MKVVFADKHYLKTIPSDSTPHPQLPASFKFKDNCWSGGENNKIKAKVQYGFKGTVDVAGHFAKDLKGKSEIAILSAPLNTIPIGKMTKTETVNLLG